jgi:hypothetical protein
VGQRSRVGDEHRGYRERRGSTGRGGGGHASGTAPRRLRLLLLLLPGGPDFALPTPAGRDWKRSLPLRQALRLWAKVSARCESTPAPCVCLLVRPPGGRARPAESPCRCGSAFLSLSTRSNLALSGARLGMCHSAGNDDARIRNLQSVESFVVGWRWREGRGESTKVYVR